MNIIDLETPLNTEKHFAPPACDKEPFFITEYGKTFKNTPCYQLRMNSPIACVQYVISGTGVIICDNKIFTVEKGDTFLLPEKSDQIYYSNPDNQFERIWLNFKGELANALLKIYKIENSFVFKNTDTYEMLSEIQRLCKNAKTAEEYKRIIAPPFLALVQKLAENKDEYIFRTDSVEQIRLYIDKNVTQNLKVSDIAKEFSFSSEHIIRSFKKTYGITPHQYILQSKIRLAMIMLKSTDLSIEDISEKLNFSDSHHFSTQFKKYMRRKPSEYRNK